MTLASRAFLREFFREFTKEKKRTNLEKIWYQSKKWTTIMLGTGKTREKGDYGLIGRIGQKFGYEIQSEWLRIDQVWYYLLNEPESNEQPLWRTDVAIEHENNPKNIEYTIQKMGEISVSLKVGIFYPKEDEEAHILNRISELISKQVTSYPGCTYLIIFGFLDEEKGIFWHAYEIDYKGNIIELKR